MTSKNVAETAGLTSSTVSRYLNGKTDIKSESLLKILEALGINLKVILRREVIRRLNNPHLVREGDDDLLIAMQSLSEIDRKTILNSIVSVIPNDCSNEEREASARLAERARALAIRRNGAAKSVRYK